MRATNVCYVFHSLVFVLRISMFDFVVDKTVNEPNVTFVSENPFLQYVRSPNILSVIVTNIGCINFWQNFKVTGKCIGQDSEECREVYKERKRQLHS